MTYNVFGGTLNLTQSIYDSGVTWAHLTYRQTNRETERKNDSPWHRVSGCRDHPWCQGEAYQLGHVRQCRSLRQSPDETCSATAPTRTVTTHHHHHRRRSSGAWGG